MRAMLYFRHMGGVEVMERAGALSERATRVGICGFSSNAGKTTLLCDLLGQNPGWEAIKVSRGHYRSCGKSREACCISTLLGGSPVVRTGRGETFAPGKDTGRYWDAGAGNVHWVICTDEQVEEGLNIALARVRAEGVFIEGTSFLKYIPVDYSIMVVNPSSAEIKSSATRVIKTVDAIYLSATGLREDFLPRLRERLARRGSGVGDVPVYDERDLSKLTEQIQAIHHSLRGN